MNSFAAGMPCNARAARFKRLVPYQATATRAAQCKRPLFKRYHHRRVGLPHQPLACRASQQEPDHPAAQGASDWAPTKSLSSAEIIGRTAIAAAVVFGTLLLPARASERRVRFEKQATTTQSASTSAAQAWRLPALSGVIADAPADGRNAARSGSATTRRSWSPLAVLDIFLTPTNDHPIWPARASDTPAAEATQELPEGEGALVAALSKAQEGVAELRAQVEGARPAVAAKQREVEGVLKELQAYKQEVEGVRKGAGATLALVAAKEKELDALKGEKRALADRVGRLERELEDRKAKEQERLQGQAKEGAAATTDVSKLLARLEASRAQACKLQEDLQFWLALQKCSKLEPEKESKAGAAWSQLYNNAEQLAIQATKRAQRHGGATVAETAQTAAEVESTVAKVVEEMQLLNILKREQPQVVESSGSRTVMRKLLAQLEASRSRACEVQEELQFWLQLQECRKSELDKTSKGWTAWSQLYGVEVLAERATKRARARGAGASLETAACAEAAAAALAKAVEDVERLNISDLGWPQEQVVEAAAATTTDVRKLLAQLEVSRSRAWAVEEELEVWRKLYDSSNSKADKDKASEVSAIWLQLYRAERLANTVTKRARARGAAAAAEVAVCAEAVSTAVAKGVEEAKLLGLGIV